MDSATWTVTTYDPVTMQYREHVTTDPFCVDHPIHRLLGVWAADWGIIKTFDAPRR